jgi:hypothetical protein
VEYPRDRESEEEGREHGVTLGELREEHQGEQHGEGTLDLRLYDPVAVATEEPRLLAGHEEDRRRGDANEREEPGRRPHEQEHEGQGCAQVGDEGGGHDGACRSRPY